MPTRRLLSALAAVLGLSAQPGVADPVPVAVFDMSFINFSQEVDFGATNEAEQARIAMLSDYLRDLLAESGRFDVMETTSLEPDLAKHGEVFTCNHCEAAMARKVGAELSFSGAVQKLSVLVQTVILRERDAETGEVLALYQTDIRGNTDIAWRRGLEFLVNERVLAEPVSEVAPDAGKAPVVREN